MLVVTILFNLNDCVAFTNKFLAIVSENMDWFGLKDTIEGCNGLDTNDRKPATFSLFLSVCLSL